MRPTVSIWIRCHRQAEMVYRFVKLVAPYADEVVVAFNSVMSDDEVSVLAAAGPDRLLSVPNLDVIERAEGWINAQCRGDWTLRFDYDEVPSPALLRALAGLTAAPDVIGYRIPRRWLWPAADRFLAQRPWWPDHQPRLLRMNTARIRFPTSMHEMVHLAGPERTLELPIYHLDLIVTSPAQRAAKAHFYAERRAMPDILGMPFNDAYYLPERHPRLPLTLPVGAEDQAAIASVLGGPQPPRAPIPRGIITATEKDIGAVPSVGTQRRHSGRRRSRAPIDAAPEWAGTTLPLASEVSPECRALLEVVDPDLRFAPFGGRQLHVAVENLGNWTWGWPGGGGTQVLGSYRWRATDGRVVVPEGLRTAFAGSIPPGTRTVLPLSIASPGIGEYLLELDLLIEHRQWFGLDVRLPIDVREL